MKKMIMVGLAVVALASAGCGKKEEPPKTEAPKAEAPQATAPQAAAPQAAAPKAEAPAQPQEQQPPVAGTVPLGTTVEQTEVVATGWSAKKQILGQRVFNDEGKIIGKVEDLIVAPDKAVSYGIIGVGGFLGVKKHDVAIPANQLKLENGKLTLPGATKEALKAMPPFVYKKS